MHSSCRLIPASSRQLASVLRGVSAASNARANDQNSNTRANNQTSNRGQRPRHQKQMSSGDQFGTMGYKAIQTQKLVTRHPIRHQNDSEIIDDKWEYFDVGRNVPVIDKPVVDRHKRSQKAKEKLKEFESIQKIDLATAKLVIECKRKGFNHYLDMRYVGTPETIPLVSQFWYKNKYSDDWFTIHRTRLMHTTLEDSYDRAWEEFVHQIHPQIYRNIMAMNFKAPTKVQYEFLKVYPTVDHVFMAGETGSGKTLAYGAPIMSKLLFLREKQPKAKALILTPSTHLKEQTAQKLQQLAEETSLKVVSAHKDDTISADDFDVLVSTPGLAQKLLKKLGDSVSIQYFVMDESDMLLDDSFMKEIGSVLSLIPLKYGEFANSNQYGAQMIFSSATCPTELTDLVKEIIDERHILYVNSKNLHKVQPNIEQKFIRVREMDKLQRVADIITNELKLLKHRILIFCKDNKTAEFVSHELTHQYGFSNTLLSHRNTTFEELEEESRILIATDMASRGLDIPGLTHVVNYDFPRHLVDYVHRIGRVGRCSTGNSKHYAITFVRLGHEVHFTKAIELAIRLNRPIQGIETNVAGLIKEHKLYDHNS